MTCDPATTISQQDITDLKSDISTIDVVVESSLLTTTTKDSKVIDTLAGRLTKLGFQAPVTYAASIVFLADDFTKTIERNGIIYAPFPSDLPFTTSGTWTADDELKFFVIQGVTLYSGEVIIPKSTVATMKADANIQIGNVVHTEEHTTGFGHEGGNLYLARAVTGATDDNGLVIKSTGNPAIEFLGLFQDGVHAKQFGGSPSLTDNSTPISNAPNALPTKGGDILFTAEVYDHQSSISISKAGVRLLCNSVADENSGAHLRYTGASDDTLAQVDAQIAAHSFSTSGIFFDGNDLAGFGLRLNGGTGPSVLTRGANYGSIGFRGYRKKGWVIGDATDVINSAQFHTIHVERLVFRGGATSQAADGLHVNAQNLESISIDSMYSDPRSTETRPHRNHIRQISGGINIQSLVSTRAGSSTLISDFAIHSNDQLVIGSWRSEDRLLADFKAVDTNAPSFIGGIQQRPDNPAETTAATTVIQIDTINAPVTIINPMVNGDITIGATNARNITIWGFIALRAGADILFAGPQAQSGIFHKSLEGELRLRGTAPIFEMLQEDGTSVFSLTDGSIATPRIIPSTLTADTNNLALGDGAFFRMSTDAAWDLTGIVSGSDGRRITLVQTSAFNLTLKHQSAGSTSGNRFLNVTGADIVLAQNEMAEMIWDAPTNRWRVWKL